MRVSPLRGILLGVLALAPLACTAPPTPAVLEQELHDGWTLHAEHAAADTLVHPETVPATVPATVPGTVHTDLLASGAIPDPYLGTNEADLQWIEDRDWVYRLALETPEATLAHDRVELVFEGLDTYADVLLDGDTLLRADNMFRTWRVPLPEGLAAGTHDLEVRFRSAVTEGERLQRAHPVELPQGNDNHDPPTRGFTRKAAYHYGWDWGPRLVTSGIWRPVRIEAWSGVRIADVRVVQESLSDARAELRVEVTVDLATPVHGRLQVRSPEGAFRSAGISTDLVRRGQVVTVPVVIEDPERWWPRGMGEPRLYQLEVALASGRRFDTETVRFGLRTARLVQEPDSIGESFYFEVNGRPLFARGANVVPLDHFTPRVDSADYVRLFDDAEAANMNMLRVWGGGIYERDLFYDLADERGILIWQDFMFANGLHPGDSAFVQSVAAEAADQVTRLRNHPSIVLWCGNNEIEEGWANWGWQRAHGWSPGDSASVWNDYVGIFHETLPRVLAELDPDRSYWPSSPSIGWGHEESLERGDSHYWGVWWGLEPFRVYAEKVPRFASEFGFQGFPDRATVRSFAADRPSGLEDPAVRSHQKHATGFETLRSYLERDLVVPPDSALADWVYATQLVQAEGMRMAFEAQRRSRPRAMGTLYWQLNDTWPVVSWSSVDRSGRWKLLHHAARRAFQPLVVSPVLAGDSIEIWIADDADEAGPATLEVTLHHVGGDTLGRRGLPVRTPAAAGARVATVGLAELAAGGPIDPRRSFVTVRLTTADGRTAENVLYLAPLGTLELPDPGLSVRSVRLEDGGGAVEIRTQRPAHFVHIDFPGAPLDPADDGFLLPGGESVTVPVRRLTPRGDGDVEAPVVRSLAGLLEGRRGVPRAPPDRSRESDPPSSSGHDPRHLPWEGPPWYSCCSGR